MPWISAGASILGGLLGSSAADDAAAAQQQSAAAAVAEQRRQYDLSRADQMPFMQNGQAANSRLAYLMGLGGAPNGVAGGAGSPTLRTADQLRQSLIGQYTTPGEYHDVDGGRSWTTQASINEQGLADAIAKAQAEDNSALQAWQAQQNAQSGDPAYGSLSRGFTAADLNKDPVYQSGLQFGLDQGTGAINSRAIQSGSYDSGGTLKALTKYANDYGSTKANESYNRFNTDQTNQFNRLSGISGTGQTATNQVQAAGTNTANNVSGLLTDAGSARSAGIIGGANAWGNAISGVGNALTANNQSEYLKRLLAGNTTGYTEPKDYSYKLDY